MFVLVLAAAGAAAAPAPAPAPQASSLSPSSPSPTPTPSAPIPAPSLSPASPSLATDMATTTITRTLSGYRFGGDKTEPYTRTETATETYSGGVLLRPATSSGGVNVAAIAGVVCGLVALIAGLGLWYFLSRRAERKYIEYESESDVELPVYSREDPKKGDELESPPPAYSPGRRWAPRHVFRPSAHARAAAGPRATDSTAAFAHLAAQPAMQPAAHAAASAAEPTHASHASDTSRGASGGHL
ncbi:hypothetical protein CC85DRAFT_285945, partial [Cutaneotrichosporon oleaginosum]